MQLFGTGAETRLAETEQMAEQYATNFPPTTAQIYISLLTIGTLLMCCRYVAEELAAKQAEVDAANAFARGTDAEKGAALTLQAAANAKLRTQLKDLNTELEGVRAELKNVIAEAAAFVEQSEAEVKSLCMQPAVPCCMHKACPASPLLAFLHLYK